MAHGFQTGHDSVGDRFLGHDLIALEEHARCVQRLLGVHAVAEDVVDDVDVANGLEVCAHHAERHVWRALLQRHGRDQGVKRPLARGDAVGMGRVEHEAFATVVEIDPGLDGGDAATEIAVERVDERDRHAVLVDDGEADGIRPARLRNRTQLGPMLLAVDARHQSIDDLVVQHVRHRHVGRIGIGDEGIAHGVGQPRGLHQHMVPLHRNRAAHRPAEALQHLEHDQRRDALIAGRQLGQLEIPIAADDGLDVGGGPGLGREVIKRVQAAQRFELGHHVLGHLTLVEAVAALLGDDLQGACERRKAHDLAGNGGAAIFLKQVAPGPLSSGKLRHGVGPIRRDARGDCETVLGKLNRRRQNALKRHRAMILQQANPAVDGTRHRHGVRGRGFDASDLLAGKPLRRGGFRCAPG